MTYYDFSAVQQVSEDWVGKSKITFHNPEPTGISMYAGGTEMLKVAPDGFWVRGVKVVADEKEAAIVYNAFKQFLTWAELNRK